MSMPSNLERVLIVDEDAEVLDLLENQVLGPMGYKVATASNAASAIQQALTFAPDLIIASLTLPGLSGKDLLVALRSQGMQLPTLVTAREGMDADAIQAFRLGARDYLVKPLREAEVVAAVERAIHDTRMRHERGELADQLSESNRQLERRVRELTTLFGIGKMVTSATRQDQLFNKLMEASLYVTEADIGWILLHDEQSEQLLLRAQRNLPPQWAGKLHQPWDDEVSTLVMLSGEALAIHGEGLGQFKLSRYGKAALIAPIKVRDRPIGVIAVARQKARPFSERDQSMLDAVADYASISLVNARLFHVLEARAHSMQQLIEKAQEETRSHKSRQANMNKGLQSVRGRIADILENIRDPGMRAILDGLDRDLDELSKQAEGFSITDPDDEVSEPKGISSG